MEFDTGKIYDDTLTSIADGKEVVVNKGGTRSGKTWSLLQCCVWLAANQRNKLISVVGESVPFLKRGAMRDFKTMLGHALLWSQQEVVDITSADMMRTLEDAGFRLDGAHERQGGWIARLVSPAARD